jgi:AraC-like DNA-binding protein
VSKLALPILRGVDGLARAQLTIPTGQVRTIAATAHACGFTDPAHFSRRFRQTYGITPRQWQELGRP